jgi:predicted nucleic acid-binding protein
LIVVDTTVLMHAVGAEHPLKEPSHRLVDAVGAGRMVGTTTVEVIQEFAFVVARRRSRVLAVRHARVYAELFSPLLVVRPDGLEYGLALFETHPWLGCFDAVLAATALLAGAHALVSADTGFAGIAGLEHVVPGTAAFDELVPA